MTTSLGNFKISTRLTVAFSALTVLMAIITGSAYRGMSDMDDAGQDMATNWMPSVEVLGRLSRGITEIRLAELQTVIAGDGAASSAFEREMDVALKRFAADHDAYARMVDPGEEARRHEAFMVAWKHYGDAHEKALALSRKGDKDRARGVFETDSRQAFEAVESTLAALIDFNHAGGLEAARLSDANYSRARLLLLGTSLVSLLLAIVTNVSLVRSITRPLQRAVAVADRIAGGDLGSTIEITSRDETGQLLDALRRMQQALSHTVGAVRSNAENVASTSAQIAQGNADLSQRTEEQASSLQEAASSMEQLGTTVKQNADSASQANGLALDASTVASKGGQVVAEVVATMRGIDQSSKRIADIIGVIDGIAFQTNILALNAAVEAARAGEQGRGFAVVASEVRSLAQRSAEAAKEIKSLITSSVEQVERGTTLVDRAGATMDEIVGSIRRVTALVSEISAASAEQSSSVDDISRAVSQMDRVTQQNAALVEESAAAADGLRGQAELLVGSVATFRL